MINGHPHSAPVESMKRNGSGILLELKSERPGIPRERLASRFRNLSDADLSTRGASPWQGSLTKQHYAKRHLHA